MTGCRYFPYTLTLKSPAVISALGGDPNSSSTLAYIPGAAVRGAVAKAFGDPGADTARQKEFQDLIFGGKVRYLNAYPSLDGLRSLPVPVSLRRKKNDAPDGQQVYAVDLAASDGRPAPGWDSPLEDRTQRPNGPWQEYRRPIDNGREQRDDQNRSILGWIKQGARFSFDIHVTNLSRVELGALWFLLNLPERHYHRFGGGKPLGFGSVRLSVAECKLWTGVLLREWYRGWSDQGRFEEIPEDAMAAFKEALVRAYGWPMGKGSFEEVSFIEAFLRACRGFDDALPTHYPRVTKQPHPQSEPFKWFVANEKPDARFALRDLVDDTGLPALQDV